MTDPDTAALLRALTVERYTNPWWSTGPPRKPRTPLPASVLDDSPLTCARRRRELLEAVGVEVEETA